MYMDIDMDKNQRTRQNELSGLLYNRSESLMAVLNTNGVHMAD